MRLADDFRGGPVPQHVLDMHRNKPAPQIRRGNVASIRALLPQASAEPSVRDARVKARHAWWESMQQRSTTGSADFQSFPRG